MAFNCQDTFDDLSNHHSFKDTPESASSSGHSLLKRKKALIIVNVQNDSFFVQDNLYIVRNHDFVLRLKELIPHFRTDTTIIWTRKHFNSETSTDNKFYQEGTEGVEISDKLSDLVDLESDPIVLSSGPSAFCQTRLLEFLRINMFTDLYLCGCLTNVDVYSTAAEAVMSGYKLNVIEDCLGYRTKEKHDEAVSQMREIMGAMIIDSKKLKEEYGALPIPDVNRVGAAFTRLCL